MCALHHLKYVSVIQDICTGLANMTKNVRESHAFLECQLKAKQATKGYLKRHCTPLYSQLNPIPIQLSQPNSLERLETACTPPLLLQLAELLPAEHRGEKLLLHK